MLSAFRNGHYMRRLKHGERLLARDRAFSAICVSQHDAERTLPKSHAPALRLTVHGTGQLCRALGDLTRGHGSRRKDPIPKRTTHRLPEVVALALHDALREITRRRNPALPRDEKWILQHDVADLVVFARI